MNHGDAESWRSEKSLVNESLAFQIIFSPCLRVSVAKNYLGTTDK